MKPPALPLLEVCAGGFLFGQGHSDAMAKTFSPPLKTICAGLFRSRLSKQIAAWVFFGIIVIEGVVFVPSYRRRRTEELRKLEGVSQEVLSAVKLSIMSNMPEEELLKNVQLQENSVIKGIALHNAFGEQVDSLGEAPKFPSSVFTQNIIAREISANGDRYDVVWPNPQSFYKLAIRHDATGVRREMRGYILGVTLLVVIISCFVTLLILIVLEQIAIRPLLLLRDDLLAAGEAISQGKTPLLASFQNIAANELGEVSTAFQEMFKRIQMEIFMREEAEADLRLEQAKTNRLLLNILPAEIAAQLKNNEQNKGAIARRFETATILFADIVSFTDIAANTSPTELVSQLNDIFSAFDAIAERYSLEKIKTIGDAYMVVGGVPIPNERNAQAVMAMAIDMMTFAQSYKMSSGHQLCLRIGINTGPVVAGVIGTKKFSYDLWGDAVNIASRMESHGVINRIQVSEETYHQLKDSYIFEDRGYLLIKGRGEMRTFLWQEFRN